MKRKPVCKCGWAAVNYHKEYDAWYCPLCQEWLEENCGDPECEFCKDRPKKPLKEWYIHDCNLKALKQKEKQMYKPLVVDLLSVHGVWESMRAMRLPKGGTGDTTRAGVVGPNDADLAGRLIRAGSDHAKALRGVMVWLEIQMQVGFMIEFETYRHGVECLSTSSAMHGELKKMKGPALAEQKQADLPEKYYTRSLTMSYQALRAMYKARRKHRHPDWQIFCDFIEALPHFNTLINP